MELYQILGWVAVAGVLYIGWNNYTYKREKKEGGGLLKKNTGASLIIGATGKPIPFLGSTVEKRTLALSDLSQIWTQKAERKITVDKLSSLWRKQPGVIASQIKDETNFKHEETTVFYRKYLEGVSFFAGTRGNLIVSLLSLLDKEFSAPSVVNGKSEVEIKAYPTDVYEALGQTSIGIHTLNVAEIIQSKVPKGPNLGAAVISAIAHDLGKLPSYQNDVLYATGDHPIVSVGILNGNEYFKKLQQEEQDSVIKAIQNHHKSPQDALSTALKESDKAARQRETNAFNEKRKILFEETKKKEEAIKRTKEREETFEKIRQEEQSKNRETKQTLFSDIPIEVIPKPHRKGGGLLAKAQKNQTSDSETSEKAVVTEDTKPEVIIKTEKEATEKKETDVKPIITPQEMPKEALFVTSPEKEEESRTELALCWFDSEAFIEALKPHINRVANRKWEAFSMRDGHVYVQPNLFYKCIKHVGDINKDFTAHQAEKDEQQKKDITFSVIKILSKSKDAISKDLIKEGFFSAKFVLMYNDGREKANCTYIPLNAHVFDILPSDMEDSKPELLKQIKGVIPDFSSKK